jgi:hypothetical protein
MWHFKQCKVNFIFGQSWPSGLSVRAFPGLAAIRAMVLIASPQAMGTKEHAMAFHFRRGMQRSFMS